MSIEDLQYFEYAFSKLGDPYIDILHNKDPNPQEHVMRVLKQAEIFCAVITPKYFESSWVQLELNIAIQRHIPIIALVLGRMANISMQRTAKLSFERVA
ncbi:MAG: hypothetical protein HC899_33230 [Leptolyngbyaceae cyanobacterium SM1_4_3]|nr:hypothetical protein [Leptolyngbyaceae cyanobacterium SM1_4_3]